MATKATDTKPTRRAVVVVERRGPKGVPPAERKFVIELGATTFALRPSGCRRGGPAEVVLPYAAVYERALYVRAMGKLAGKGKRRGRK